MSNASKGKAIKGSKFWMQTVVNSNLQSELNSLIGADLTWLSPLKDEYLEYKLNQEDICKEVLGVEGEQKKKIFSFWPGNQPQWDGIALSKDKKTLYLVEAKAHLSELDSKLSASSNTSVKLIKDSMKEVFQKHYSSGKFEMWIDRYYQLGNRLTFLNKLNDVYDITGIKVKLVLLNFVEDYTYKLTTEDEWKEHYKKVFYNMTGNENPPEDVIVINFLVRKGMASNPIMGNLMFKTPQVLSYGFSEEENRRIKSNLPKGCSTIECNCFSDLITYNSFYHFINPAKLTDEELRELMAFYNEDMREDEQ